MGSEKAAEIKEAESWKGLKCDLATQLVYSLHFAQLFHIGVDFSHCSAARFVSTRFDYSVGRFTVDDSSGWYILPTIGGCPMKRTWLCFLLVLSSGLPARGQTKTTNWTVWLPARNPPCRNYPGVETHCIDFTYRWRLSTPCSDKDCGIELQIHNRGDRRASVNYTVEIEHTDGSFTSEKDHRNFDVNETQDIPLEGAKGQRVEEVKIEAG